MVEEIRADPFVPNDVNLGGEEPKSMVITGTLSSTQHYVCLTDGTFLGPNMVMCAVKGTLFGCLIPDFVLKGGKSSCVRMIALIAIMAQIGRSALTPTIPTNTD